MTKRKTKKSGRMLFFKILSVILVLLSVMTIVGTYYIDILPFKYLIILISGIVVIDILVLYFLLGKGWKKRMVGTIMAFILLIVSAFAIVYELDTIGFLKKLGAKDYKTLNYSVIVLNSSKYKKVDDIKDEYVGILKIKDTEGMSDAVANLNKKVKVSYKEKEDLKTLEEDLLSGNLSVILLEDAYYEIAKEENIEFGENTKVVYKFSIDIKTKDNLVKEADITKEPFNIFIAGIDTYGKISSVSRSDVNMVVTVNPKTNKILLTSIPRDYYVYLHGITSYKDKITHAGIHGIDMSVKTVEDLLDCDINYYVKVNFTSVVDIVNAIGGIEVESPYTFTTFDNKYTFSKGYNKLDGEKALYFVRERKAFTGGDRTRNQNQQLVLKAMINKMISPSLLTNYNKILKKINKSFVTNLDDDNITNMIKKQLKDNKKWTIESYYLTGSDSSDYTYSYKRAKSYVMQPDEESIKEAQNNIKKVLKEGKKK